MNWGLIWRGLKTPAMRNKVLAVLGILVVYRALSHIPVPLADPATLEQVIDNLLNENSPELVSFLNVLSGGALSSLSIMLAGLGPYINASIIMQVLTKVIPKLETMQKEGEFGRRKINQYTRILTLPIAIIQSFLYIYFLRGIANPASGLGDLISSASLGQWALIITALTAGAMILMWLGELITEQKIGNGISLLITVAIISQLPSMIINFYQAVFDESGAVSVFGWFNLPIDLYQFRYLSLLLFFTLLVIVFVVYLNEAHRKIKINYAKKVQGNRTYSDVSTHLPIKLIAAGVIPIIFAVAILSLPQLLGQTVFKDSGFGDTLVEWFSPPLGGEGLPLFSSLVDYIYPSCYFLLVVLFTYFYTGIVFNSKDIAEQLQRQGGFIAGVRPGLQTQKYLTRVVNRLNLFGSISLGFLALTPILAQAFLRIGSQTPIVGGTSILILVAVALETLRQVESKALMVTYEHPD